MLKQKIIYEYKCENCKNVIEKLSLKPKAFIVCNKCNKKAKKTVSVFSTRHSSDSIRSGKK